MIPKSTIAKNNQRRLRALKAASDNLGQLVFPQLVLPNVGKGQPLTLDITNSEVQLYCFSILSHYREMLKTFLYLTESGTIPSAFVISRCLFEMGAHSYYTCKHIVQHLEAGDLKSAREFLKKINMGSLYMQEASKRRKKGAAVDFPVPREIGKIIRCFSEWGKNDAAATYSYLSEFSHPNMAAFSQYYKMEPDQPRAGARINFIEPTRDPLQAPLPETSISLVAILHCTLKLLSAAGETNISSHIANTVKVFMKEKGGE